MIPPLLTASRSACPLHGIPLRPMVVVGWDVLTAWMGSEQVVRVLGNCAASEASATTFLTPLSASLPLTASPSGPPPLASGRIADASFPPACCEPLHATRTTAAAAAALQSDRRITMATPRKR